MGAAKHDVDAETSPLSDPTCTSTTSTWRRSPRCGGAARSCRPGATRPHRARVLVWRSRPGAFQGRVSDSGEGRWTLTAAVDEGVPSPCWPPWSSTASAPGGNDDYANRILAAMRHEFGGHVEKPAAGEGGVPLREAGPTRNRLPTPPMPWSSSAPPATSVQADLPCALRDGPPRSASTSPSSASPRRGGRLSSWKGRALARLDEHGKHDPAVVGKLTSLLGATSTVMTPTRRPSSRCARMLATRKRLLDYLRRLPFGAVVGSLGIGYNAGLSRREAVRTRRAIRQPGRKQTTYDELLAALPRNRTTSDAPDGRAGGAVPADPGSARRRRLDRRARSRRPAVDHHDIAGGQALRDEPDRPASRRRRPAAAPPSPRVVTTQTK